MSPPSVGVTLRTLRQVGLSFPVQQSRGSLRSQREPSIRYIVARGTLPSGAAEPQLPSEAVRVPPPIALNLLSYSAFNGASPPSAAEPWLPLVTVWALRLSFELRCVLSGRRGSPSRCSRATAPFGHSESPSTTRSESFWLIQHRTGLPLPVQQGHGSLRSQCEPSVCRLKLRCVLGGGQGSPSRCSRAVAPLGHSGGPPPDTSSQGGLSLPRRTGLPLPVQQSHSSLRSQCGPSVCQLSYAAYSAADGALPPGAAELQAPFGRSGSPRPTHQNVPRLRLQEGLALPVQQSRSSLRKQREPLI
ncbi:hypothetical protein ROHU_022120 [Labeo rohita]|uniref:Uncharacterized protein n=1 Tax=Labeo rohita TaxID=84645 RepID=A0A498MXQ1_LABRO|nr:hypothetical protein ROHU_022120 [Labeo rohita]